MKDKPDFEALRAERNRAIQSWWTDQAEKYGWGHAPMSEEQKNACYCDCATGGLCEHDFQGWREFEGGNGGERVCTRCGMGAMHHSLVTCP